MYVYQRGVIYREAKKKQWHTRKYSTNHSEQLCPKEYGSKTGFDPAIFKVKFIF